MRKRAKVDQTHGPIVEAFRKGGWSVLSLAPLGGGAPDLLVYDAWFRGPIYLIEVKAAKGKLREAQIEFSGKFPVYVLRSVDETLTFMDGRRRQHETDR